MTSREMLRMCCGWAGATLLLTTGCTAPPQARETVRVRDLATPAARTAAADHFWMRVNVPDLRGLGYRRVAIAEFVVEFVTAKVELTSDLEELLRQHPEVQERAGGAVQSVEVVYTNEYDYPTALYKLCCEDLTRRGLEVLPARVVVAASAYRRFETEPGDAVIELNDTYAGASDTGRIRRLSLRTVPGLGIVRGGGDQDVEVIAEALREELNADVVLRIRLRLGTFSGHATLERGSVIHAVTQHTSGTISTERSLISDEWVIAESQAVLGGWQTRVNLPKHRAALAAMCPVFIQMAFDSADVAPRPASTLAPKHQATTHSALIARSNDLATGPFSATILAGRK